MRSESQSFEYDEGSDEGDEAFEATDEGSDEADEAFEATDEGADEADEAFEASDEDIEATDEGADESDEGSDESEAMDEAMSASARLSARVAADRDREQRRKWAAQLASDRQREAKAASAVQQSLTSRLRDIRGSGRTRTMTLGNLNGVRRMEMTLANGRRAVVQVMPPLASANEVNRLRTVVNKNELRRAASDTANSRAIRGLAVAQANFVKRQTEQQVKSDRELGNRIVQGNAILAKRITTEISNQKANIEKHDKRIFRRMKKMRYQLLMNDLTIALALPAFRAFGKPGNLFASSNLALTGVLATSLVIPQLPGMATGMGKSSKAMSTLSTTLSTVAPIVNVVTDFLLFHNKQHERFVTGVATITDTAANTAVPVDLPIAKGSSAAFTQLTDPPAVATVLGGTQSVTVMAEVVKGQLMLTLSAAADKNGVQVAWVVDTEGGTPATA